jgi:FAD/FMN-containing dehydrogenase
MNDIIPEAALKVIEERFGSRFVRHAASEAKPEAEQPFASVFPDSIEEIQLLARLATRYHLPLMAREVSSRVVD